jgi:hypothetical protein
MALVWTFRGFYQELTEKESNHPSPNSVSVTQFFVRLSGDGSPIMERPRSVTRLHVDPGEVLEWPNRAAC